MEKLNKNNGITLIALVISIIVMLILVAVSISMAVNGGLFNYAGKAVGDTQNAIKQEQEMINNIIDNYFKGNNDKNDEAPTLVVTSGTEGKNGWYTSNVTVTITPQNGISKTTYVVTGDQNVSETEGTSVIITAEGTSTITAYAYNTKGEKIASEPLIIKKDSIAPTFEFQLTKIYAGSEEFDWAYRNLSDYTSGVQYSSMKFYYTRAFTDVYECVISSVGISGNRDCSTRGEFLADNLRLCGGL